MRGRADRWDYALAGALGVLTVLSRLPYVVDHWAPSVARPEGLVEIELPYGRFFYTLAVDRRQIAYAGYTLVRDR
jgi:hypothetical protein